MNENEIKNALTQIGNDLRQAERLMFSGKTDEAMLIITKTGDLIEQVKAAEPQNSQIRSSEPKYLKLKGDIEKAPKTSDCRRDAGSNGSCRWGETPAITV
jgi:hypothetical protein